MICSGALHRGFLGLPDFLEIEYFFSNAFSVFQNVQALALKPRRIFLERFAFDFQLNDASIQLVERFGFGIDFHADSDTGFVDQVDGFVGQLPICNVAMADSVAAATMAGSVISTP